MSEDITLETIDEKEDIIIAKLDDVLLALNNYGAVLNSILTKINSLTPEVEESEPNEEEPTGEFRAELEAKINEGLPYDQVKQWIISKLEELGLYSEADMVIKIFVHRTGDMILEFKVRPYNRWGDAIQFFQSNMGDTDYFETSRYTMKNIMWWRLNKNQQMEEQTSDSSIIDAVTDDWGDRDNANQYIGQGK